RGRRHWRLRRGFARRRRLRHARRQRERGFLARRWRERDFLARRWRKGHFLAWRRARRWRRLRLGGRLDRLDHAIAHEAGKRRERGVAIDLEVLGERLHVALAVDREHDGPAIRRERDRALLGGTLGETEARAVGRDHLTHGLDPLLVFLGLAQVVLQLALEVPGRCLVPRRELEVGTAHVPDRAERRDGSLVREHGGDDPAFGEAECAFALVAAKRQLAGLLRLGEQAQQGLEWEVTGVALERHRSATSVCLSN